MSDPRDPDGAQPDDQGPPGTPDEEDTTTEPDVTTPAPAEDAALEDAPAEDAPTEDAATQDQDHAAESQDEPPRSGLRNPIAAVRGIGAGALAIEAVILLLAIVPLRALHVRHASVAIGCVLGILVLCVVLAGMMRHEWAWKAGIVPPILVIACGYFHFSLAVIGVLFLLVWLYVLSVRRTVLGRGRGGN